eukprot:Phypoly_transcript_05046.p1 GENE.Phypoly_transcript_05046~~Phypoly_transcript_05046.p1  ORF type:complete len:627 (+),score=93.59 Phypoly_transcript_05046:120-2000(+)
MNLASTMQKLLVLGLCFLFVQAQVGEEGAFNFVVLSDLHIGESSEATNLSQIAIDTVNSIVKEKDISFVIITGDITSSALPEEYELARQMLDSLTVPYYPIFGNHDVWTYVRPTNESSWEEKVPTGDLLFAQYFEDIFIRDKITYNFDTVWNPEQEINSTFLNWEMRFPSPSGTFVLYGLDFVTREAATNPKDLYKGGAPTASLHDFPGGTLQWFKERLDLLPPDTVAVVTAHHHTVVTTPFFTPDYFSMNETDRSSLQGVLLEGGRKPELFWGALVGHMHFWDDQQAMFSTYRQWETTAAKSDGSNGITVVNVRSGTIQAISRCCGVTEADEAYDIAKKTISAAVLFVFSAYILKESWAYRGDFGAKVINLLMQVGSLALLATAQLYPLTGGNGFITKHINADYMGPIVIGLTLVFAVTQKNLTRASFFGHVLIFLGTSYMDYVRYPIRTAWLRDGENYNVFWVYITVIGVLVLQALRLRKHATGLPLVLSFLLGVLMELVGSTVAAIMFRLLSPIELSLYDTLEKGTIVALFGILVAQFIVMSILTRNWNVVYCITVASAMQTLCNSMSQLVLRSSSFPILCTRISVALSLLPVTIGIIALSHAGASLPPKNPLPPKTSLPLYA